jgi:hypothetical protein
MPCLPICFYQSQRLGHLQIAQAQEGLVAILVPNGLTQPVKFQWVQIIPGCSGYGQCGVVEQAQGRFATDHLVMKEGQTDGMTVSPYCSTDEMST